MFFEKIKSEGLAHFSYMIGDKNEAAVIDPRRDIAQYLAIAQQEGVQIKYILETHRNEDFIIGSKPLASVTGADIFHADTELDYQYGKDVEDGAKYKIGRLQLEAIHTPGHTKGSHSYLLSDYDNQPWMIFTGDILFAGDTGRIDFYGAEELPEIAGMLYDSLYNKIMPLGAGVIICPAHGAGSVCGSQIADKEFTTIGIEKKSNPYLQYENKEDFVAEVGEIEAKPAYFEDMEAANLTPPASTELPFIDALNPTEFEEKAAQEDTIVVDIRSETDYATAHLADSLYLWENILASFIGWLVETDKKILLINDGDYPQEAVRTLYRMGYENLSGYLSRGILSWNMTGKEVKTTSTLKVTELCAILDSSKKDDYTLLDIRKEEEKEEEGYITGAKEIPLTELEANLAEYTDSLKQDRPIYIFCGSGMRSMTAASLLEGKIDSEVVVALGGLNAWSSTTCPLE
ncbi:MAG: MBL fold metallo-hydrolase [Halanaerobacter sp.]